jgi:hypothetical protein
VFPSFPQVLTLKPLLVLEPEEKEQRPEQVVDLLSKTQRKKANQCSKKCSDFSKGYDILPNRRKIII